MLMSAYVSVSFWIVYEAIDVITSLAFKGLALVVRTLFHGQKMIMPILETPCQLPTSHFQKISLKTKLKREVRL